MNRRQKVYHRINEQIRQPEIRIVGDNIESKVCTVTEAMRIAEGLNVDVVEINSKSTPPVCRLVRYDKYLYEEKKKAREVERKNRESRVDIKELRFRPNTDTHDVDFKLKHAIKFLTEGDKVKAVIKFSGRELAFKDRGQKLLLEFVAKLEGYGIAESLPKMEGKWMSLIIKPISKK